MESLRNIERYNVILASGSPRRRELLSMLGLRFDVRVLDGIDESYPEGVAPDDVAPYIAGEKCRSYIASLSDNDMVITADTVVISNGKVLGKPASEAEACSMLRELSGHCHKVVTGVAVATKSRMLVKSSVTEVEFASLDDVEIADYVTQFKPLDKAGAYGIQEWIGCIGVKRIDGSFYNVMGLPLHVLYTMLKTF